MTIRNHPILGVYLVLGLLEIQPMTKDEFVQRREAIDRESPRFDWLVAVVMIALAAFGVPLSKRASEPVTFIYIGILLAFSIAYLVYSARWAKQTGLLCHTCHRPMLRRAANIALATGTCPHCRKAAFGRQA